MNETKRTLRRMERYLEDIEKFRIWRLTEKAMFLRNVVSVNPTKFRIVVKRCKQ